MKIHEGHLRQEKDDGPIKEERNSKPVWFIGPKDSKTRETK
jgi:hypothetical protein